MSRVLSVTAEPASTQAQAGTLSILTSLQLGRNLESELFFHRCGMTLSLECGDIPLIPLTISVDGSKSLRQATTSEHSLEPQDTLIPPEEGYENNGASSFSPSHRRRHLLEHVLGSRSLSKPPGKCRRVLPEDAEKPTASAYPLNTACLS